jgi:hypothetical protein
METHLQPEFEHTSGNILEFPLNVQGEVSDVPPEVPPENDRNVKSPHLKTTNDMATYFNVSDRCIRNWSRAAEQGGVTVRDSLGAFTPDALQAFTEIQAQGSKAWLSSHKLQEVSEVAEGEIQEPEVSQGEFVLDPGVLALYNQAKQQESQPPINNGQLRTFFKPEDYQNRYQSAQNQLSTQFNTEVNFANELLTKCAEMANDNAAWNQAEKQKEDANQRAAAIRGMQRALNDFLNENVAYRGLKEQLESGQITPEQVLLIMSRLQQNQQSPNV